MALGRIEGNTVLDSNGNPISGAVVRFYEVGTLTSKTIYSDIAQSVSLGTYITTDASGRFQQCYLDNPYKIRVETSLTDSTLIYEQDHVGQDIADIDTQTEGLLTIANVQNSVGTFATTGGSSNAYTLTLSQAISSYQTGQFLKFKANHTNTGASTINVSNVGVVALQSNLGTDLVAGDIVADGVYSIIYDGTGWKLTNSQGTNQSTIQVNTINELTTDNGVNIDGVLLKDNDITATDLTLSGNIQVATATVTSDLNTDDITERTTGHGVEIDGVLLKDGDITINNIIKSNGDFLIELDADANETGKSFSITNSGVATILSMLESGLLTVRSTIDANILRLIDNSATNATDANIFVTLDYQVGAGSVVRIGLLGFTSTSDTALELRNEITDGNLELNTQGTGQVLINTNTAWHSGNDGDSSGLDADLLDGQHGSYYRNATNINAGTINDAYLPATISSDITGNAATATTATTATNATQLNSQSASFYTNASNLSSGTLPDARLSTTVDRRLARAWASFNGTGTPAINSAYNVASITDNGTGDYTVNFTSALSNANYAVVVTASDLGTTLIFHVNVRTKTTSSVRINVTSFNGDQFVATDADEISLTIFST